MILHVESNLMFHNIVSVNTMQQRSTIGDHYQKCIEQYKLTLP